MGHFDETAAEFDAFWDDYAVPKEPEAFVKSESFCFLPVLERRILRVSVLDAGHEIGKCPRRRISCRSRFLVCLVLWFR